MEINWFGARGVEVGIAATAEQTHAGDRRLCKPSEGLQARVQIRIILVERIEGKAGQIDTGRSRNVAVFRLVLLVLALDLEVAMTSREAVAKRTIAPVSRIFA